MRGKHTKNPTNPSNSPASHKVHKKPAWHQIKKEVLQNRRGFSIAWYSHDRMLGIKLWVAKEQISFLKKLWSGMKTKANIHEEFESFALEEEERWMAVWCCQFITSKKMCRALGSHPNSLGGQWGTVAHQMLALEHSAVWAAAPELYWKVCPDCTYVSDQLHCQQWRPHFRVAHSQTCALSNR